MLLLLYQGIQGQGYSAKGSALARRWRRRRRRKRIASHRSCFTIPAASCFQGILGQGSGKALEAKAAVDKATRKALKHLTYVPRFRGHTIHYPITVLYGKTKVRCRCTG